MEELKSSVKQMLAIDIQLKEELNQMFKLFARRLTVVIVLISTVAIITIVGFLFYFTKPTRADMMVFRDIQKERALLKQEREVIRIEREQLQRLQMRKK